MFESINASKDDESLTLSINSMSGGSTKLSRLELNAMAARK
jgi:hypothetical protein